MDRAYLVVDVGDVHDKVDVVAKVITENPSDNVLGEVVSNDQLDCQENNGRADLA